MILDTRQMAGGHSSPSSRAGPRSLREHGRPLPKGGEAEMTALLRHEPGVTAPVSGMYGLVGHFGEPAGVAVWFDAGEKLPLAVVSVEVEHPLWYVQIGSEAEATGLLAA